jgi:hypothetical protein
MLPLFHIVLLTGLLECLQQQFYAGDGDNEAMQLFVLSVGLRQFRR